MTASEPCPSGDRRGFLAVLLGLVALAVPAAAGVLAFLNPWRQKSETARWIRVTTLDALPIGGPPQRFPVIAERSDAWNRFEAEPIGAVYLCRTSEKQVAAVTAVCPHAGCFVSFDAQNHNFYCPCHGAHFDAQGTRTDAQSMSPRDLDTLEVMLADGNEVRVKFEAFRTGTSAKMVKS